MKQRGALKHTFNRYMVYSTQSEAHSTQLSRYGHLQDNLPFKNYYNLGI